MKKYERLIFISMMLFLILTVGSLSMMFLADQPSAVLILNYIYAAVIGFFASAYLAGVLRNKSWSYPTKDYFKYLLLWVFSALSLTVVTLNILSYFGVN
jgi:hypothetical protein